LLALLLRHKGEAVEQRLDEWGCEAQHKARGKRHTLDVTTCCVPLVHWVVALWRGTHLAVALDATALGVRLVVLTVSVVYRGCAIAVAWTILPANQPQAWRRAWRRMRRQVRPAMPVDWTVLVLADRGWWARWLLLRRVRVGWHPLLRINQSAKLCPVGPARWYRLRELVGRVGQRGRGPAGYRVSKHAVVALSEMLYHQLAQRGAPIKVSVLCPSGVDTQLLDAARNRPADLPAAKPLRPEEEAVREATRHAVQTGLSPGHVAECVFRAIAADQFYILTHPEAKAWVRTRMEDILQERNPTPEGA
jgi:NAD(P)-dependent dehydrogenase (short-subunit alcohol dehydrogenase family)